MVLCLGELALVQLLVEAALRQQFFVGSALNDVAGLHDQDLVSVLDGRQAMGHDKARAALHQLLKGILHQHLGTGVDAGRCLIQNQNWRASQHDTGNAEQLPLALADVAAVLTSVS